MILTPNAAPAFFAVAVDGLGGNWTPSLSQSLRQGMLKVVPLFGQLRYDHQALGLAHLHGVNPFYEGTGRGVGCL